MRNFTLQMLTTHAHTHAIAQCIHSGSKNLRNSPLEPPDPGQPSLNLTKPVDDDQKSFVLQVALKCADLGHLPAPQAVHRTSARGCFMCACVCACVRVCLLVLPPILLSGALNTQFVVSQKYVWALYTTVFVSLSRIFDIPMLCVCKVLGPSILHKLHGLTIQIWRTRWPRGAPSFE